MKKPETQQVMAALLNAGAETRFIGGCVRDSILKRDVHDIDIATTAPPERVIQILENENIRVIPTGLSHGTVTAVIGTEHFEITTLRVDAKTDGRRAEVEFITDWTRDAARRDFTINAMSCDLGGNIYDPYDGLKDLSVGYIRFIGIARERIEEDLLRLLRFFRFLATYGKYPVSADALYACTELAPRLGELSAERVRTELFRTLVAPNPATTIRKMIGEQVLKYVLPEATNVGRLRVVAWLVTSGVKFDNLEIDPIRHLAAVLDPEITPQEVTAMANRLKISNKDHKRILAITAKNPQISSKIGLQSLRRACFVFGADTVIDVALLSWGTDIAVHARLPQEQTAAWINIIKTAQNLPKISFPLTGRDVMDLGITPGPEIGEYLRQVQKWWVKENFNPTYEDCLNILKKIIK